MALIHLRRLLVAAVLAAAVLALVSSAHGCDNDCTSCPYGVCLACKSGHYLENGDCEQCHTNHCLRCQTREQCTVCEPGYQLRYVADRNGENPGTYGKCVNAASSVTAYATLLTVGVALLFTLLA